MTHSARGVHCSAQHSADHRASKCGDGIQRSLAQLMRSDSGATQNFFPLMVMGAQVSISVGRTRRAGTHSIPGTWAVLEMKRWCWAGGSIETTAHWTQHCKHGTRSVPSQTQSSAATSLLQLLPSSGRQSTNTQPSLSLGALRRKKPIITSLHPAEELNSTSTEVIQPSGKSPPSTAGTRSDFLGVIISSGFPFPRCSSRISYAGSSGPAQCQHKAPSMPNRAHTCRIETLTWLFFDCTQKPRAAKNQINFK